MIELTKQQIDDMRTSLGKGAQPFTKDAIDSLCALAIKALSPEEVTNLLVEAAEYIERMNNQHGVTDEPREPLYHAILDYLKRCKQSPPQS